MNLNKIFFSAIFLLFFCGSVVSHNIVAPFFVPIECAMGMSEQQTQKALSRKDWQIVKELYDEHIIRNLKWSDEPRISKIIHHIWLGGPLPKECVLLRETWKKHHPDWEFMLWTEKEIEEFGLKNRDLYDETPNYGAKSDIARLEILYHFGGLYVDTDFECIKPFDGLHHCCDFYVGADAAEKIAMFNGMIGSSPGHPILKECIDALKPKVKKREGSSDIMDRTGPYFLTRCFFNAVKRHDGPSVVFPATYFYPWSHRHKKQKSREQILSWVRQETLAIHHWHVSWIK